MSRTPLCTAAAHDGFPSYKLTCPHCQSRLEVIETASGSRTVCVARLSAKVENSAKALERFYGPDAGPDIACPACVRTLDSPHFRTLGRRRTRSSAE